MTTLGPFGFIGGWNTKASAYTLPKDQMSDAQNVQVVYGDLVKVNGSKVINASALGSSGVFTGITDWQTAAGQRYLVGVAGTKMAQMADINGTYTDITGAVTVTAGQNNQSTFASLNNLLVRCGGATPDAPIKWSGTGNAAALGGSPPSGNIVTTANNFMFISGIAATPSRVYYSNVADPETWGASNWVDVRVSDGDRVTALAPLNQNVIVFKRRSVSQLWTNTLSVSGAVVLGPLNQIAAQTGCVGSQAIDILPDGRIAFLGTNAHVYIFDGTSFEDISDTPPPNSNIQPTLTALNAARLPYAVLRVYPTRNQIWISISSGTSTTNNQILIYDYQLKAWQSPMSSRNANVMAAILDTRATPANNIIMVTGNYSGTSYEHDTGSSNPESTNNVIDGYGTISIQIGVDDKDYEPRSALVPIEANTGNLEVNYGYDDFTATSKTSIVSQIQAGGKLDLFVLDVDMLAGSAVLRKIVNLVGNSRSASIQFQFRNRLNDPFTIHPVTISDEVLI